MSLTNEYFSYFPYAIKGSGGDYESVLVVANSKAYDGDGGYCEQALSKKHYDDDAVCGTTKNTGDRAAMWTATTTAASQPPLLLHFDRGLLIGSGPCVSERTVATRDRELFELVQLPSAQ
ncbi:hypothetical protein BGZ90_005127 [Linnemannia elongata]|nr:hypothetical protein BGZ90_005127 [Linnemannia elongata]